MSSVTSSPSLTAQVSEPRVSRYSRFIEDLDEAPAIRSPNSSMSLIWQPKDQSPRPHSSAEATENPFLDETEIQVGKVVRVRISNTHLKRSNAIHRPRRSGSPHPSARRTLRVVNPTGPVTFSESKMKPRPVLDFVPDDEIPPLDLGPPLSPLIAPQKSQGTQTELPGYPAKGQNHPNDSDEALDYELVEPSPETEQRPARNPVRSRLSKIGNKIVDGIWYVRDPWGERHEVHRT